MKANTLRRLINLWPPFLFSGIRSTHIGADYRRAEVQLRMRWFNRNYVGSHFGGSLFAMTDPWCMLLVMKNLGADYWVWDQRAAIEFVAPGRGVVSARIEIDEKRLAEIVAKTANGEKYTPEFTIEVFDEKNALVARVSKTLYVRRKPERRHAPAA